MVLRQSMRVTATGLLVGGGATIAASRWIQSGYYGIVGIDARAFTSVVGLFFMAMALASAIPAVRASRVDPVQNLRDA
jgi:ABC-type lipoprotein release transport system permease subunit